MTETVHRIYDLCVITAANEHQAQGYREQLKWRKSTNFLPEETEFLVFADPQGKRIGSGGSTIYVLYSLLKHFCHANESEEYQSPEELFKGKRILILHSGGDSTRLPSYSAVGKIFIPIPADFCADGAALFDLLFNRLMHLPKLAGGQVVVASGDALLSFDASEVVFSDSGVTGLAYPGAVEVASKHDAYIVPQTGENPREVVDFLQRPTYDELQKHNGLDTAGRAFIATGILNFSLDAVKVLMDASGISLEGGKVLVGKGGLCEKLIDGRAHLDIYEDFHFAMLGKNGQDSLKLLQQITFSVCLLPRAEFLHLGTSKELLRFGGLANMLTPESDLSSEEILSWCVESEDYAETVKTILALIQGSGDILFRARLYKLLSGVLRKAYDGHPTMEPDLQNLASSREYEDVAFELVREAVRRGLISECQFLRRAERQRIRIHPGELVRVCAPVRLDFAAWSDLPSYCQERGGGVLNVAVKLNGQHPIQVTGKVHPELVVRITSIDLGDRVVVSRTSQMLSYQDPHDWCALPKAAFVAAGVIPEKTRLALPDILKELGGGFDLVLSSAVPAGSGLGTSSILAAAIIACLSRMLGQELTQDELFNRTIYAEQLMTTGGGWQDQIGGVVGGVKYIRTEPGLFQVPTISYTDLRVGPDMDLSDRFLLYYTGYRRMAKNILRNIVAKYLDRDPVLLKTMTELQDKALEMKVDLDRGDIDAFGKRIAEVWELNKRLDSGTSNEDIEGILSKFSHLAYGSKLLGAGGGGFLFIVTKGEKETREIRRILTVEPPNARSRFFDFGIDQHGLRVNVL